MSVKAPRQIEHIGIAVKDLEKSVQFYTELLGLTFLGYETVESEKVRTAFLEIGETRLELLEATSPDSPIAQFIEKKGEGIHHIAFQVDNSVERTLRVPEGSGNQVNQRSSKTRSTRQFGLISSSEIDKWGAARVMPATNE